MFIAIILMMLLQTATKPVEGFAPTGSSFTRGPPLVQFQRSTTAAAAVDRQSSLPLLWMAPKIVSQAEALKGIDKVVTALRKDTLANAELGKLEKVTIVLGFGAPTPGTLAVRFNASFKKQGKGLSAVPLPFGLGQSNMKEGRGTMVGQVKASINSDTGKLISCSVFRDLGYGRSFELKV